DEPPFQRFGVSGGVVGEQHVSPTDNIDHLVDVALTDLFLRPPVDVRGASRPVHRRGPTQRGTPGGAPCPCGATGDVHGVGGGRPHHGGTVSGFGAGFSEPAVVVVVA